MLLGTYFSSYHPSRMYLRIGGPSEVCEEPRARPEKAATQYAGRLAQRKELTRRHLKNHQRLRLSSGWEGRENGIE